MALNIRITKLDSLQWKTYFAHSNNYVNHNRRDPTMKAKTVLFLLFLPSLLFAIDFSDNFDSYSPGDNLDSSPYWLHPGVGANLLIADEGGNNVVETSWGSDIFASYVCLGSAVWLEGSVSTDVKFTGTEAVFGVVTRLSGSSSECYMAGIYPADLPPLGATVIAYVNASGEYTSLSTDYYFPMSADTWYNLTFEVTGANPVELKLSVNGVVNSTAQDNTHNLGMGMAGVFCGYDSAQPMFYMDNFEVDDYDTALTRVTFGGIKTLFR